MRVNGLRYLIMSEGGATAFLATALARPGGLQSTPFHRAIWSDLASRLGIALSEAGPSDVRVEDGNLDLVLLWDEWCIVFESKIRSASVRGGQLREYYERLREAPDSFSSRYPGARNLAMVFLTPCGIGASEFSSLSVMGPDRKAHFAWEDLLSSIESALAAAARMQPPGFFEQLLRAGTAHLRDLLGEIKTRAAIEVTDEQRLARRQFALDVQAVVIQRHPEWAGKSGPLWTAPTVEEVYLSLDELRSANAYFSVFSDSAVIIDEEGPSAPVVRWWVKVASKHRNTLGNAFRALDKSSAITQLGLSPELSANIEFDPARLSVKLHAKLLGPRSELVALCASILERFVLIFQQLLVPRE